MQLIALDSGSCNIADTLILPVVVTAPPCSIILDDSSNVSCFGGNDGFITVQGSDQQMSLLTPYRFLILH